MQRCRACPGDDCIACSAAPSRLRRRRRCPHAASPVRASPARCCAIRRWPRSTWRRATWTSGCRRVTRATTVAATRCSTCTTARTCSIPATSYGHVDWAVDETMTRLIERARCAPAIVVGVWSTPQRREEYMPQRAVQGPLRFNVPGAADAQPADIISDRYLAFLVQELKPFIDANVPHAARPRRHLRHGVEHGRPDLAVRDEPVPGRVRRGRLRLDPLAGRRWHRARRFRGAPAGSRDAQVLVRLRHRDARCELRAVPAARGRDPAQGRLRRRTELDHEEVRGRRALREGVAAHGWTSRWCS